MRRIGMVLLLALVAVGVVRAAPPQQTSDFRTFLLNTRADLELLANTVFGEGQRPPTWTFNVNNLDSPTFIADLWFDSEQVAEQIFGRERPPGWIGAPTTNNPTIVARNIRHDLELSAAQEGRPAGWRGGPAITRCDRTVMNLQLLLANAFGINLNTAEESPTYCADVTAGAENQVIQRIYSQPDYQAGLPDLILTARGDLERLADEEYGVNSRPPGWRRTVDRNAPTLLTDVYLDLDTLATTELGQGMRPDGWIGLPPPTDPALAYRNLRRDLELVANSLGRVPRPRGWQGTDPLGLCAPDAQTLVLLAQLAYGLSTDGLGQGAAFCAEAELAAHQIVENPPAVETGEAETPEDTRYSGQANYAFSYLDSAATQFMGIMPPGTKFRAWYRNFGESTMMFVSGEAFALFIDLRWTSMDPAEFLRLPTLEGVKPLTFCDAKWCNGPGPTPTPTGGGALLALLNAGTPPAPPDTAELSGDKTKVSWNNIRVTYLLDKPDTRTAQVALEICTDTSQTDCEAVLRVFDNAVGALKPVLSQFNGLNVYEFPYGYSSNLLIEGSTLFSEDVWISDPTIR